MSAALPANCLGQLRPVANALTMRLRLTFRDTPGEMNTRVSARVKAMLCDGVPALMEVTIEVRGSLDKSVKSSRAATY